MGVLTVYLDKAENLCNSDIGTGSDPYVKFEIEQDNWVKDVDYGTARSSTKNNNLQPVYGETFTFTIPTLHNMVLSVKIMDEDTFTKDDNLGSCKIHLEKLGLSETPMNVDKVIDRNLFTANGKIFLKLSYKE